MLKEFKEFIMQGSLIDLAVAVIIAGAFGKVMTSFVSDVLMPPIGLALGGVDFKDLKYIMQEGSETIAEVAINYGSFIQNVIDFTIIGFIIFLVVRTYNNAKKKEEEAPAGPSEDVVLLGEIRDLLKK